MNDNREDFLEKQINLYADIIDGLEGHRKNHKEKKDLQNMKDLYKKYVEEYKALLLENINREKIYC